MLLALIQTSTLGDTISGVLHQNHANIIQPHLAVHRDNYIQLHQLAHLLDSLIVFLVPPLTIGAPQITLALQHLHLLAAMLSLLLLIAH